MLVLMIRYMWTCSGERWNHELHVDIFANHLARDKVMYRFTLWNKTDDQGNYLKF